MGSPLTSILMEEKQTNLDAQKMYIKEMEPLRKGSIVTRVISGREYYYLAYWQDGQTKVKYIGKDKESLEKARNELAHRKYLQKEIRRLKDEYKRICKFIKE